jgi:sugar/nucleoside kinase (ribokinase family)
MLPFMNDIWRHLRDEVLKPLPRTDRLLFVDLADPAKRTREDLRGALELLGQLQQHVHVVLGLNLQEAVQVAAAIGWPAFNRPEEQIEALAVRLQRQLRLGTVVIHPRAAAAAADQHGSAWFAGPFVKEPKISTGAGDHFNAGFVTARLLGLNLAEALGLGTATSGYYVRHAQSPTLAELMEFIRDLPPPEA